ncbi:MAG: DMT family transporter [Phycisphaerales bacterium]|nr:DMT family transporter [Phycisphaerales bacterium]
MIDISRIPLIGEALSLAAAISWAFAVILFKLSGQLASPLALNLFKNTLSMLLFVPTILLVPGLIHDWHDISTTDLGILCLSGFLGIAIADVLFFYGLDLLGVGLLSITECAYTPFVLLMSVLLLGERPSAFGVFGAVLVVSGVLAASGHAPPAGRTTRQIVLGIVCGLAAMGTMAFGIVYAKPALERVPLLWAATIRMAAGTAPLWILALLVPSRRKDIPVVLRPSANWRYMAPAAFLGTYLAFICWLGGYKYTTPTIAAVLNQSSTAFSLVLATLLLREPMTLRKALAVGLAASGALIVALSRAWTEGVTA